MAKTVNVLDRRVYGYDGPPLSEREYRVKLVGGMDSDGQRTPAGLIELLRDINN